MRKKGWQAIVAGVGGQGVLFVTRVLATAARATGAPVFISEVHGMAQRGGAVVSHLRVGDFASPLVPFARADTLLSLDPGEAVRNLAFVRPGAWMVVNAPDRDFLSPAAQKALKKGQVKTFYCDASGLGFSVGAPKGANVALLAAAAAGGALPFTSGQLWEVLADITPLPRLEMNQTLFRLGEKAEAA